MSGLLLGAGALAAAGLGFGALWRKVGGTTGDLRLHRLAPDVWVYRGFFSNSAALVLPEGVAVVDTQTTPAVGARLRGQIARVTPRPVRWVINTHYHGDHVGGNNAFADAEIVAPEETARLVVERDQERVEYCHTFGLLLQDVPAVRRPDRTFRGRTTLESGGETLEIMQLGRCETPDAAVVWWPSRRALMAGDGVATDQYPWLGVPFLDEGLQADGEWLRYLDGIAALRPRVLIPGHGRPLVGERHIQARLELLRRLLGELLETVRGELAKGAELPAVVERVDQRLAPFRLRPDLVERVVSQRFAIYRAINSLSPERRGRGWWQDLRPSAIRRAPPAELEAALAGLPEEAVPGRAAEALAAGERPLALALLERHLARHPEDGPAWALLSEVQVASAFSTKPIVDGMEYARHAAQSTTRALELVPDHPLARLNRGVLEAWSALVTGQDVDGPVAHLQAAVASGALTRAQEQRACFFVARALDAAGREAEAAPWFARLLPWPLRWLGPLLLPRLRTLP